MVVSHRVPNPAPARTSRLQPGAKPFTQPHRNRCFVNTRYDAEGNQISKTRVSDGEQWSMTWDYRNRMTQDVEKTAAGVTVTNDVMTYDVEGRRIGKSTNGTQVWFGYNGQNEYADFNSGGTLTERYLTGKALDSLYARFDGTNTGWYLDDMLGSVRQIVNTSGTVLDALTYDSYGQILTETNSGNGDRFKYTSREWDSEIALQFNRDRYDQLLDGRWTSQDPKRFAAGDRNLYRYVFNNPIINNDPTGLEESTPTIKHMDYVVFVAGGSGTWYKDYMWAQQNFVPNRFYTSRIYYPITSGSEIIEQLCASFLPHSIGTLILEGHGSGCGIMGDGDPIINEKMTHLLGALGLFVARRGLIQIFSCDSGTNPRYMKDFANAAGVPVVAPAAGLAVCGWDGTAWLYMSGPHGTPNPGETGEWVTVEPTDYAPPPPVPGQGGRTPNM